MTESHMYLLDIKSIPLLNGQNNNRNMSSIRLDLLTITTWKLKTPGGILVVRVLVQVRPLLAPPLCTVDWFAKTHTPQDRSKSKINIKIGRRQKHYDTLFNQKSQTKTVGPTATVN